MYRREHYERMWSYSHDLSAYSDEELEDVFEYRHGGERIRKAFAIWEQVKRTGEKEGKEANLQAPTVDATAFMGEIEKFLQRQIDKAKLKK